jgi:hypothetical protein
MPALALWARYTSAALRTGITSVRCTPILACGSPDRQALLTPLSAISLAPHRALHPSLALAPHRALHPSLALHAALALDALLASLASFAGWSLGAPRSGNRDCFARWRVAPQR